MSVSSEDPGDETRFHRHSRGFSIVDNALAQDRHLSYRALGLLIDMLSRPPGWKFSAARLSATLASREDGDSREGREAVLSAMRELEAAGYMRRTPIRTSGGHFRTITEVSESPTLMPITPEAGFPTPVESPDVRDVQAAPVSPEAGSPTSACPTPVVRTVEVRTEELPPWSDVADATADPAAGASPELHLVMQDGTPPASPVSSAFEVFWRTYPRRVARAEAKRAYDVAYRKVGPQVLLDGATRYRDDTTRGPGAKTCHAASWLRAERWADEEPANTADQRPDGRPARRQRTPGQAWLADA